MNKVPRHRQIVAHLLSNSYPAITTAFIGGAEVVMFLWIVSGWKHDFNVLIQVIVIASMNIIEFLFVRHLLLWKGWNAVFALLLILLILFVEFYLK